MRFVLLQTFAFIRFANMLDAYRAKKEMHLEHIGPYPCKIGYGRTESTCRIWIGNLEQHMSTDKLECEMDRFGAISELIHFKSDGQALVQYKSIVAAEEAKERLMGSTHISSKPLLVDFDEPNMDHLRSEREDDEYSFRSSRSSSSENLWNGIGIGEYDQSPPLIEGMVRQEEFRTERDFSWQPQPFAPPIRDPRILKRMRIASGDDTTL